MNPGRQGCWSQDRQKPARDDVMKYSPSLRSRLGREKQSIPLEGGAVAC